MNPQEPDIPVPAGDASDEAAAPADAPPPKPRRAPRRKAAAAPAENAADATPDAAATATPAPAAEASESVSAAATAAPQAAPRTSGDAAPVAAAGDAGSGEPGASGAGEGAQAGPGGEPRPGEFREGGRRGRNRRRGRGGARGEPREAAPEGEAAPDAATADARPVEPAAPPVDSGEVFAEVLSGAFDAEPPEAAPEDGAAVAPPKRILAPEPEAPKLHKVLAQAGIGSRREMEQLVVEGRITVNGEPAHIGQRISYGDRITVAGKPVKVRIAPPPARVLAYHKPAGEVVTHDDPQHRPTVFRKLPRLPQGKWQSVGRLDLNTEGLLLFTNSGDLANQLMHPRFGVEREYAVRSLGVLDEEQQARLLEGVEIDGQRAGFKSIEDGGGEGVNHWYRVVITEGRHREVRRLFEAVGHAVSRLIRIRYGCVVLPRGLKRGVWVDLSETDVRALRRLTGVDREGIDGGGGGGNGRSKRRRGGKNRDRLREGVPAERPDRPDRPERGPRADRGPRGDRVDRGGERPDGEIGHIPNPLQQTYDKRAIQQARQARRELPEDAPIPNPLQQTYDKRALQRDRAPQREVPEDGPIPNPLQQTFDKRFVQKGAVGGGGGGGRRGRGGGGGGGAGQGGGQPDPMKTSMGYIGADAFRNRGGGGGRGGSRGRGGKGR